ncbi:MAG: FAD-dependent oxidoreductase [Thermoplasmata archaeon]|nr:MAG: FAD-dependent oxidoreductase [Thermoplasmata archaeon]
MNAQQSIKICIDSKEVECQVDQTVLDAALNAGIYIPTLCYHPDMPNFGACGLCAVEIEGDDEPSLACITPAKQGMVVNTSSSDLKHMRQEKLAQIITNHPHACLVCAEREGCAREPCSLNVPMAERCCEKFGDCEVQRVAAYIGIPEDTPRYKPRGLPVFEDNPFIVRDYNLCIGCGRCVGACTSIRGIKALGDLPDPPELIDHSMFPEKLIDRGCQFCRLCIEVCPTGSFLDRIEKIKDLTPCQENCPAHVDIPRYLRQIAEGKFKEAIDSIRERNPFPTICGRVCHHPCEEECLRSEIDNPVAIRPLKRLASDYVMMNEEKSPEVIKPTRKERVAIVGAGPSGLTCALELLKMGYPVTIFEASDKLGGMMTSCMPDYRISEKVAMYDIDWILAHGIEGRKNTRIGRDTTLEKLRNEYKAVYIAIGSQDPAKLNIEGSEMNGVLYGLPFLREVKAGKKPKDFGKRIIIIGGGNVAIDCAKSSLRLGAKEVHLVCLETRNLSSKDRMPAHDWEIEEAEEDGVSIHGSLGAKRILGEKGRLTGIETIVCTSVYDKDGGFVPKFSDKKGPSIQGDTIIIAVGQQSDFTGFEDLELTPWGTIKTDETTLETNIPGVFAGGDVVQGPASVVEAVGMGSRAAVQIHLYLGGLEEDTVSPIQKPSPRISSQEDFLKKRIDIQKIVVNERLLGFTEVELPLNNGEGIGEAVRCLQCDLCLYLSKVPQPPVDMLPFKAEKINAVPEGAGVYTLYDEDKNVIEIKGTANLRQILKEKLESSDKIKFFKFEEDPMYSKRESELLQQYTQQHGEMPSGGDELDDLF